VRLTGGEPLLRPDILECVRAAASCGAEVALTTNAQRLAPLAAALRRAGLGRVNVSLDALGGELRRTLDGIDAALAAGLAPVRANMVVLRGLNEGQVLPLAAYSFERGVEPRFLELMALGAARRHHRGWFVPAGEVLGILATRYELRPLGREPGRTAARYEARLGGRTVGTLGIIAPESAPFCSDCRRLRLSADGRLLGCLMQDRGPDLRPHLDGPAGPAPEALAGLVRRALAAKCGIAARRRRGTMASIGG